MSADLLESLPQALAGTLLPEPTLRRWQPLRLGLVELYRYDSEEFWFRDGHLLLRGNNGTGKSKVLSLTLPFLLDAQLRSSRIEPDGDPGKKMAWNLLLHGAYERRVGYTWIEFGRLDADGTPRYLTLGAGLSAVAARPQVEAWFFILDEGAGARIGRELWLMNPQRVVLGREKLREALAGRGQIFDSAQAYRRAVDERLFRLGQRRYDALVDTLIQLRQPQLSRRPDEAALSQALTEALPPLPAELLADVAEAMAQLEEDRRQLEDFEQLERAVERFDQRYRVYAGMLSRRQARELRQAQTEFDTASRERGAAAVQQAQALNEEAQAKAAQAGADSALAEQRARLETLQSDPRNQDANRLAAAERDAAARGQEAEAAARDHDAAGQRLRREAELLAARVATAVRAEQALQAARGACLAPAQAAGIEAGIDASPVALALLRAEPEAVAAAPEADLQAAGAALRELVRARRQDLALLRRHCERVADAEREQRQRRQVRDERRDDGEAAAARRAEADAAVEEAADAHLRAWAGHGGALLELQLDLAAVLEALAPWVREPRSEHPARAALHAAQQAASQRLAERQAALQRRRSELQDARGALQRERDGLLAGTDPGPPPPPTRGAGTRAGLAGAPLWQLVDFRDDFQDAAQAPARAGLEAALQAGGLLDAWVTPDGALLGGDGRAWHDAQWVARAPAPAPTLARWLRATPAGAVPLEVIDALLQSVHAGAEDAAAAEVWVAADGRFRIGTLQGAWTQPQALHIGHAARAAARARRLAEIAATLDALAQDEAALAQQAAALAASLHRASQEWRSAPADDALRQAHDAAAARSRECQAAQLRLEQAAAQCRQADDAAAAARQALERDAADLRLPVAADGLQAVDEALLACDEARGVLLQAAQAWRLAWPEREQQRRRQAEAQAAAAAAELRAAEGRREAVRAGAAAQALRDSIGLEVDALLAQLAAARAAVAATELGLKHAETALRGAGEARAVAVQRAVVAEQRLAERSTQRSQAIERLQRFAASGLLASALPALEVPGADPPWTIEPALALARRAEQALAALKDDDESWKRVQHQINEDLQDLQRSLGTLGHQASAEPSDFGLVVQVVYQNRPERPDRLAARLQDEIAQRRELLSARERELLENHLQDEIAAEVQRLLQAAERQVAAINTELHKRPTSTGVRYRLLWQPLAEGEGAPVGLHAARERLLRTSADLWSAEDRRVVGRLLQQRIADERQRGDAALGSDGGGGLIDQLARALDYRHWHVFRVQRLQDGQWRKLSGPASSGERALGLTVPLFAAVASFYSQGGQVQGGAQGLAPRLMLLDEAFAGIDDAARAHCMGLIREFDLDFVITSEREWGCYAELPGVAICQLQRREGIDAVYVSRWWWDGRSRRREADPDRRFPPADTALNAAPPG